MKNIKFSLIIAAALMVFPICSGQSTQSTCKPWTFWFWMGDAVNQADIKTQLREFAESGLGGVHIVPVYGAKGYENQFIPFLSEQWLEMVQYTITEARKVKMDVDVSLGTGWPFGGPWIDKNMAAKQLVLKAGSSGYEIKGTNQNVKRPAPGGEGLVMDYYDKNAVQFYLHHYDSVFAQTRYPIKPRAWFHDSYEAYAASWSAVFPDRFHKLNGYGFDEAAPILADTMAPLRPYVLHDYRQTLADLLYTEFASTWTGWCTGNGSASRYQAHGSPGNLLDLYGLSDIPETESFGCSSFTIPGLKCDPDYEETTFGRPSQLMMKFASSPAHLLNKPLVSCETATWLAEHFKESLSQIKPQIDELFISGINHIIYQGSTYSPKIERFPGWLFYASTNFGSSSHFWDELPLLNSYITECQTILQNTEPDNDILLYFPIDELWTKSPGDPLLLLDVHHYAEWFGKSAFGGLAKTLWDNGYSFDYISDKQIARLGSDAKGKLSVSGHSAYSVIVVPPVDYINMNTFCKLDSLAQKGARIIFAGKLPENAAGLMAQKQVPAGWNALRSRLSAKTVISRNILNDLSLQNIRQETIKMQGLSFIRKKNADGTIYFITNLGDKLYRDSIALSSDYRSVELFDPQTGRKGNLSTAGKFFLSLPPGKSVFISTRQNSPEKSTWKEARSIDTIALDKEWTVNFTGDNNLPVKQRFQVSALTSWTGWGDDSLKSICGKGRYRSVFTIRNFKPGISGRLVFDEIHESAKVTVNGTLCGTIWSLPWAIDIPAGLLKKENTIEITVQNLSANRIRQVDRQKVPWKKFYDINFVNIKYRSFDASDWPDQPSGLIGKVKLIITK